LISVDKLEGIESRSENNGTEQAGISEVKVSDHCEFLDRADREIVREML
jgi:hypothetical protein